ncbi:MAG: hypothetical protein ACREYF_08655 [Gammaproteobacteria bacterium]
MAQPGAAPDGAKKARHRCLQVFALWGLTLGLLLIGCEIVVQPEERSHFNSSRLPTWECGAADQSWLKERAKRHEERGRSPETARREAEFDFFLEHGRSFDCWE